jgi:glycosyltransferase involved in cell wall biosynthesis
MSSDSENQSAKDPGTMRSISRPVFRLLMRVYWTCRNQFRRWIGPRLGLLQQHRPRPLRIPASYLLQPVLSPYPRISIVTASLNQGEFIESTIDSVLGQHYPELEYIINDGGSMDGTVSILKRHASGLAYWCSQADAGQTDALNLGFSRASGDILAYLNADDLLLPGALHYIAGFFQQHPEVDVVYGHRILIDEQDREIGKWILPPHDDEVLRWADYVPQETLFWRRSLWDKVGARLDSSFDFAMDWDLLLRFLDAGARFERLPRYLGAFRVHPQQKTSSILQCQGRSEMSRLHKRCHGSEVSTHEVNTHTASYLLKQMFYDRQVRAVDLFRPKVPLTKP